MFIESFLFEWRYFAKQPATKAIGMIIFVLAFLVTSVNRVSMGGANLLKNGPYAIVSFSLFFLVVSIFFIVYFVANTALRNETSKMSEILYCQPIKPFDYHLGRFLGSFSMVLIIFAFLPLGLLLGSLMPWVEPARLGPFHLQYYVVCFLFLMVPTLFTFSTLFYALARRFRSMTPLFFAALGCLAIYEVTDSLLRSPDAIAWAALADPFGLRPFEMMSRYWTLYEKNHQPMAVSGLMLQNRLLWLGVGAVVMMLFGGLTKPLMLKMPRLKTQKQKNPADGAASKMPELSLTPPKIGDGPMRTLRIWLAQTWFETKQTLGSRSFILLLVMTAFFCLLRFHEPSSMYGTPFWPRTFRMVSSLQQLLPLFIIVTVAYYPSEIIWRDRQVGVEGILSSYPLRNGSLWLSKLVALWMVLAAVTITGICTAIFFQLTRDYQHIELTQYLVDMGWFSFIPYMMLGALAMFLSIISPNKYVGICLYILYLMVDGGLGMLGVSSNLFQFAQGPITEYSEMNGFGGALVRQGWFLLYWGAFTTCICCLSFALWQRGPVIPLRQRLRNLGTTMGSRGKAVFALGMVVWLSTGAWIYYNTRILNEGLSPELRLAERAAYETTYQAFRETPVPVITDIDCQVDIFPEEEKILAEARFTLRNDSEQVIDRFLVSLPEFSPECEVSVEGGELLAEEGPLRTFWFQFQQPMNPGETREGRFKVRRQQKGFTDGYEDVQVVENGTFINNVELFPVFGFKSELMLEDVRERARFQLPVADRLPEVNHEPSHQMHFLGPMGSMTQFSATVSTSADQIALAPGYLKKEWETQGRRYFRYEMDAPIVNFYAFTSARLTVKKEVYKGVSLEVYYHPGHGMNIPSMMAAARDTLDYLQAELGPYQHRQFRIVEYPLYRKFAQSFANTVPYSELGFLFDLRDSKHIDPSYKTTAHEMAHQWWGHQVGAAKVQGWEVLVESITQYWATRILQKTFGETKLRPILKYELAGYLRGRTREVAEELPLLRSQHQPYIHYHKGVIAFLTMRDLLGEARFHQAMREFYERYRYRSDPYPTTVDLMGGLQAQATSDAERDFIAEAFQDIVLYDLQIQKSEVKPLEEGGFEVELVVQAQRFKADGEGREQSVPMEEWIDIALFANHPDDSAPEEGPLYLQKHKLTSGENRLKVKVAKRPQVAGIDPFIKRIDRNTEDNLVGFD